LTRLRRVWLQARQQEADPGKYQNTKNGSPNDQSFSIHTYLVLKARRWMFHPARPFQRNDGYPFDPFYDAFAISTQCPSGSRRYADRPQSNQRPSPLRARRFVFFANFAFFAVGFPSRRKTALRGETITFHVVYFIILRRTPRRRCPEPAELFKPFDTRRTGDPPSGGKLLNDLDGSPLRYTHHGHKLRLFTLREAQFVTGVLYNHQHAIEPACARF